MGGTFLLLNTVASSKWQVLNFSVTVTEKTYRLVVKTTCEFHGHFEIRGKGIPWKADLE